jgi:hypothetical protein
LSVAAASGFVVLLFMLFQSQSAAPRCVTGDEAVAELRAAHEAARRAHLDGDVSLMAPGMAEQMVLVSNGNMTMNPKEKTRSFFDSYFKRVKYLEWSDAEPPLINVSPDGQMGWMAVKVRARYVDREKPEAGEKSFRSSWIATYQRVGCQWKMTGNASAVVSE